MTGRSLTTPDGLWIIALGETGTVGLSALTAALLLPAVLAIRRYPVALWKHPAVAPVVAVALCVVLYMADCLVNAMLNPTYVVAVGGLATLVLSRGRPASAGAVAVAGGLRMPHGQGTSPPTLMPGYPHRRGR